MNKERRETAQVCIELIKECHAVGEMADASHKALEAAIKGMKAAEFWGLKGMSKHEGANDSTDKQIAISRVALPALEAAAEALNEEDYASVITQLEIAVTTDGTVPKRGKTRKRVGSKA